jgi:hypothetical protein
MPYGNHGNQVVYCCKFGIDGAKQILFINNLFICSLFFSDTDYIASNDRVIGER